MDKTRKIEIQNELINVLLKNNLTFEEMQDILTGTKYAIGTIVVPQSVTFKHKDGTLAEQPTETF